MQDKSLGGDDCYNASILYDELSLNPLRHAGFERSQAAWGAIAQVESLGFRHLMMIPSPFRGSQKYQDDLRIELGKIITEITDQNFEYTFVPTPDGNNNWLDLYVRAVTSPS